MAESTSRADIAATLRMDTTTLKLMDILVIELCSQLSGGQGFKDMHVFGTAKKQWLETFLQLPYGIPCRDTFNRVFSAIDGKALRRALNGGEKIPYIVSASAKPSVGIGA